MYGIELEIDGLKEVIELLLQKGAFLSKELVTATNPEIKFSTGETLARNELAIQERRKKLEELESYMPPKEDSPTQKRVESTIDSQVADKIYNIGNIEHATIVNSVSAPDLSSFIFKSISFQRPPFYFSREVYKNITASSKDSKETVQEIKCNLNEALDSFKYIVLIGDAGMGKTTELQWVAHDLMDNTPLIPIYLRLKDKERLNDFPIIGKDIEGQIVLIVDGLDESRNIESMAISIEDFRAQHPDAKILVSCRSNAYMNTLNGFEKYTLGKITQDEIHKYAEKELGAWSQTFLSSWYERNPWHLTHLLENPFYLINLCIYFKDKGYRLPRTFGEVFELTYA